MVVAKRSSDEKMIELPSIDLSMKDRCELSKAILKACDELGFFKVTNHGVPHAIMSQMERESFDFFAKPLPEKQLAFGYGLNKIGFNGDVGDVEYILLHANPNSNSITTLHPDTFRCVVRCYIEEVKRVGSEILDLIGEGLQVAEAKLLSSLIHHADNDSLFRINHYPLFNNDDDDDSNNTRIGIGEHSDPQLLTILSSNHVPGLQISLPHRLNYWLPVPPDPTAFWVHVGDLLQAMSNGRFVSVRHRALTTASSNKQRCSRLSMAYFAAPALSAWIEAPKELVGEGEDERLYRPFTWGDYKKTTYSLRLGESRLHLFKLQ